MTLTLRYAVRTDPGLVRETNQDSVYAGPRLLAVADGMGGMAAGDLASSVVITKLSELDQDVPNVTMIDALDETVTRANHELQVGVDANPELRGMGTTLTALLFSGRAIAMVHIGDSRAYLLRDGRIRQVTKDHTYVQMLVDQGAITAEEASHHPHRSLVTQVLQGQPIEPNFSVREAIRGDRYLLCSDGLSNVVSMETIAEVLREYRDPDECAERLIDLALRAGGPDNITAIVADLVLADPAQADGKPVTHRADAPPERRPSPRPRPRQAMQSLPQDETVHPDLTGERSGFVPFGAGLSEPRRGATREAEPTGRDTTTSSVDTPTEDDPTDEEDPDAVDPDRSVRRGAVALGRFTMIAVLVSIMTIAAVVGIWYTTAR
jgi:serine/threonine protein phosphatase PrpC